MIKNSILITGVAGFLGSNLASKLLLDGHVVIGIDNYSMGHPSNITDALGHHNFSFIEADVTDSSVFDNLADQVDYVVHLAAFKIPRYGNAIDTLKINFYGTINVLDFCKKRNIKCVLASTSDVYGKNKNLPFSENTSDSVIGSSKSARWSYAVSKLFDEHLALAYQDSYGIPVVLLRFFGAYGPHQPLSWWGGPPPVFINAILSGETIPIHGDGQQTRSFTYVSDTVEGICAAIFSQAANGEILNIGSAEEVTILELAQTIQKASGVQGELAIDMIPYESFTGKKYEDVRRRVPDTTLSEQLLGVKAKVSLLEGLKKTIEWQRQACELRPFGMPS